jgi:hypothetical protein
MLYCNYCNTYFIFDVWSYQFKDFEIIQMKIDIFTFSQ